MIWATARWPSMVAIRAATSWLMGGAFGAVGSCEEVAPLELGVGEG